MTVLPVASLDHVVVSAREHLDEAASTWRRLGFTLTPRGHHTLGSSNHLAMFATDYLELIGVPPGGVPGVPLLDWPAGLNAIVFGTEDADATHAALARAGIGAAAPIPFSRPVELGGVTQHAAFRTVNLPPEAAKAGRFYFCEHRTRALVWRDAWRRHRNGVVGIETVVVVSRQPEAIGTLFRRMFGEDSVTAVRRGIRLAAGLSRIEVIEPDELERRFGDAAPSGDDGTEAMAALVLRTESVERAADALRDSAVAGVREAAAGLLVPASSAGGVCLLFSA